jgi:hypothetical protein
VAPRRAWYGAAMCERWALAELDGLGDPRLGEWREWSGSAFHLRRRLSTAEQVRVGPPVDIRGTDEARQRVAALGQRARFVPPAVLAHEVG